MHSLICRCFFSQIHCRICETGYMCDIVHRHYMNTVVKFGSKMYLVLVLIMNCAQPGCRRRWQLYLFIFLAMNSLNRTEPDCFHICRLRRLPQISFSSILITDVTESKKVMFRSNLQILYYMVMLFITLIGTSVLSVCIDCLY